MGVTVFPAPSAAAYPTWVACNNTTVRLTKAFTAGLYRVSAIVVAENGTPSVTLVFKNSAGSVVYSDATVDSDSGSSVNAATRTVYLSSDAATLDIATASNTYVSLERIGGTFETTAGLQLFVYTTSQNITIDGTFSAALIIGGGGAGGSNANPSGTGGSSGYIASTTSIAPGVYPLVVGAGGTSVTGGTGKGGNGGTTTFAGMTAAGGNGGAPTNAANPATNPGGSGGGGSVYNSNQAGGNGGSNGSQGGTGGTQYGTWVGSYGSGVAKPSWLATASTGGAGGAAMNGVAGSGGGGAGGFYGGGGGGGGHTGADIGGPGASAAPGTGGGGGATGFTYTQPSGAGGSGGLYLVKFA